MLPRMGSYCKHLTSVISKTTCLPSLQLPMLAVMHKNSSPCTWSVLLLLPAFLSKPAGHPPNCIPVFHTSFPKAVTPVLAWQTLWRSARALLWFLPGAAAPHLHHPNTEWLGSNAPAVTCLAINWRPLQLKVCLQHLFLACLVQFSVLCLLADTIAGFISKADGIVIKRSQNELSLSITKRNKMSS